MKVKLLFALFFLTLHFGFSQTEKSISGKITSENFVLQNVDVINKNDKKSTTSDALGQFTINSKVGDTLIFYKKDHFLKEIQLNESHLSKGSISVQLTKKSEELDEVIITKAPKIAWKLDTKWEQTKRDEISAERDEKRLKNTRIDDLTIDKGLNLARIGKTIFKQLVKEKPAEIAPEIDFKQVAKNICDSNFYSETLQLKPEEIELFLQFCDADPQSKKVLENTNVLSMMDFLSNKIIEFRKR